MPATNRPWRAVGGGDSEISVSDRFGMRAEKTPLSGSFFIFRSGLNVLVLGHAVQVFAALIGRLPADGGNRTSGNGVVGIRFRIFRHRLHAGETHVVEVEDVSGDGGARAATDAGGIYVGFFHGVLQIFESCVHWNVLADWILVIRRRFESRKYGRQSRCGF